MKKRKKKLRHYNPRRCKVDYQYFKADVDNYDYVPLGDNKYLYRTFGELYNHYDVIEKPEIYKFEIIVEELKDHYRLRDNLKIYKQQEGGWELDDGWSGDKDEYKSLLQISKYIKYRISNYLDFKLKGAERWFNLGHDHRQQNLDMYYDVLNLVVDSLTKKKKTDFQKNLHYDLTNMPELRDLENMLNGKIKFVVKRGKYKRQEDEEKIQIGYIYNGVTTWLFTHILEVRFEENYRTTKWKYLEYIFDDIYNELKYYLRKEVEKR